MPKQNRRRWRTRLIAALLFAVGSVLLIHRCEPSSPITEAHDSINTACDPSDIYSQTFFFSFTPTGAQSSTCVDAFRAAARELGFSDTAVASAINPDSNTPSYSGSIRISSQTLVYDTPDSSFEEILVEVASCERSIIDASPGFEMSQLFDRVWSSACDNEFLVDFTPTYLDTDG